MKMKKTRELTLCSVLILTLPMVGCGFFGGDSEAADADAPGGGGGRGGGRGGPGGRFGDGGQTPATAVPVEVFAATRQVVAQFLETNGTVEAENEVDLVARISGPIVELLVEEGMLVQKGQLLARIDPNEIRARLRISEVNLEDAKLSYERAKAQVESEILSRELYDQAKSNFDAAQAQVEEDQVQLGYTDIKAPFRGVIVNRYIKFAEHLQSGAPLFRISDFNPLQTPIQVPEKDLARLAVGQPSYLTVEAFPEERFDASVLRISPVVDSATGTVKVTLEVETRGKLRPGMFASVFLETDRRADALAIPKSALVLESIGDTVYVKSGEVAERREVRLGYSEAEMVEVLEGVEEGDQVVVLGQDSLSDGTPIYILSEQARSAPPGSGGGAPSGGRGQGSGGQGRPGGRSESSEVPAGGAPERRAGAAAGERGPGGGPGGPGGGGFDPSQMTPEMIERMTERMRGQGLSDEEIAKRIEQIKNGESPFGGGGRGGGGGRPGS